MFRREIAPMGRIQSPEPSILDVVTPGLSEQVGSHEEGPGDDDEVKGDGEDVHLGSSFYVRKHGV